MVSEIRRIVEEGPLGVRTVEKFVQACLQQAATGAPDAVGHFVLAKLAEPFADYYADQALSDAEASGFRKRLLAALTALEAAPDAEARQEVLRAAIREGLADVGR